MNQSRSSEWRIEIDQFMAKGCWLATGTLNDPRDFMIYTATAEPDLQKYGTKMFNRDAHTDVREGNPGYFTVLIECPSVEGAKAAYAVPEYQDDSTKNEQQRSLFQHS